jgi:hypothetical protein
MAQGKRGFGLPREMDQVFAVDPVSTYPTTTPEVGNIFEPSEDRVTLEPSAGRHGNNLRGFRDIGGLYRMI